MQFKIKNYKKIVEADVEVEGLTIVMGSNRAGKSTAFNGIKATMLNQSNDSMKRHGQKSFEVFMDCGGKTVKYSREKKVKYVLNGDENNPIEKLNHETLQDIYPDFPLRFYQFKDVKFFPNFVFQQKIPVFDTIEVVDLLSSMFDKINILNQKTVSLKSDITEKNKVLNILDAAINQDKKSQLDLQKAIEEVDFSKLEADYNRVTEQDTARSELADVQGDLSALTSEVLDLEVCKPYKDIDFKALREVYTRLEKYHRIKAALDEASAVISNSTMQLNVLNLILAKEQSLFLYNQYQTNLASFKVKEKSNDFISQVIQYGRGLETFKEYLISKSQADSKSKRADKLNQIISKEKVFDAYFAFIKAKSQVVMGEEVMDNFDKELKEAEAFLEGTEKCPTCEGIGYIVK